MADQTHVSEVRRLDIWFEPESTMNRPPDGSQTSSAVRHLITVTVEEARLGTKKLLSRNDTRLEVSIPAGAITGSTIRLSNILQVTDGRPGDILIEIRVEEETTAGIVEINDGNFEDEVLKCSSPVAVDFWGFGCAPCNIIARITEKLAREYAGRLKFCKLNVDLNPETTSRYQVMSIPRILYFKAGQIIEQSVGAVPESALRSKTESVLAQP
jgi:thioredoxin 1